MTNSRLKSIITGTIMASSLVMSMAQAQSQNYNPPGISDQQIAKDIGAGAAIGGAVGVVVDKLTGNHTSAIKSFLLGGTVGAAAGGVTAAVQNNQIKNQALSNQQSEQQRLLSQINQTPQDTGIRVVSSSLITTTQGTPPEVKMGSVKINKKEGVEISADSLAGFYYAFGAILKEKYNADLNLTNDEAAELQRETLFSQPMVVKMDTSSKEAMIRALTMGAKVLNKSVIVEEFKPGSQMAGSTLILMASDQKIKQLRLSRQLQMKAAQENGYSVEDLNEELSKPVVYSNNIQQTYIQRSNRVSYNQIQARSDAARINYNTYNQPPVDYQQPRPYGY